MAQNETKTPRNPSKNDFELQRLAISMHVQLPLQDSKPESLILDRGPVLAEAHAVHPEGLPEPYGFKNLRFMHETYQRQLLTSCFEPSRAKKKDKQINML